jgi:penicillin-binding protein 1A
MSGSDPANGDRIEWAYQAGRVVGLVSSALGHLAAGVLATFRLALAHLQQGNRKASTALRHLRQEVWHRRGWFAAPASLVWRRKLAGESPRPRRWRMRLMASGFAGVTLLAAASIGGFVWAIQDVPLDEVAEGPSHAVIILEDQNGEVFARQGPIMGPPVTRGDLPDHLVAAVLSIEDRRFAHHVGIDPVGVVRAFLSNWRAGQIVQGGSTITQQLAKLSLGDGERTWERKIQESALALWLEARLTKDEILARYLNNVYLGSGVVGISGAAQFYFGKEVGELTLAESAMLAGMIHAPSRRNPLHNWDGARARASVVLDRMVADGAIDAAAALPAKASPAKPDPHAQAGRGGSWFADWMFAEIADHIGSFDDVVHVRTTLDPEIQRIAEEVVGRFTAEEGESHRFDQAALVAMRPDGAVLAMVGGRSYAESRFNRATQALRQPGSAFKTFVYLAALRQGYRLDTPLTDGPIEIGGWRPTNYDRRYHGRVTLADAFARSLNAATARLAQEVGIEEVIRAARDLGIRSELAPYPSLALGTSEVTLLDLTAAYGAVRAGQMPVEPWGMVELGKEGSDERFPVVTVPQRLEPLHHREELIELMRRVVERGTGRRAALDDAFAAGKTGTSQGYRDAWFIGFTDNLIVGVWLGNDDSSPMARGLAGGRLPAMMWRAFVSEARPLVSEPVQIAMAGPHSSMSDALGDQAEPSWQLQQRYANRMPCDLEACARRYRSFRASDCTFQPYRGPRMLCPIAPHGVEPDGWPPQVAHRGWRADAPQQAPGARAQAACDVNACARRYRSFRASDCTFQPYRGPRRLCPIQPRAGGAQVQAQASSIRPPGFQCDVRACARRYRSFRASDCTFQPYRGPRRLCTR